MFKRIGCKLFGHRLVLRNPIYLENLRYKYDITHVVCERCKKDFGKEVK